LTAGPESPKAPLVFRWSLRSAPLALLLAFVLAGRTARAESRSVTLREAVHLAMTASPAAVDARLQRDVQDSQREAAALPPLQNPTFDSSVERGSFYVDVVASAQMVFRFEVSGQRAARMREVDELLRARDARIKVAHAEVSGAVADVVGSLLAARERIVEVKRGLAAAEDEERMNRARAIVGDATVVDVASAEAEAGRWRQVLRTAEMAVVSARARLAQLVADDAIDVSAALFPPEVDARVDATAVPAARALEAEASASLASAERSRREANPTLDFGPRFTRGDNTELRSAVVLSGQLPLFRRNQAEIARAEAEAVRAKRLAEVSRSVAQKRVRSAEERLRIARAALADLEANAIPSAERTVSAANEAFRAGKADFFRVLLARRDLVTTRMRRIEIAELAWAAYAELLTAGAIEP
jgi:cobalt-zinc-cadmium efflux system outer membrane protein